MSWEKNSSNPTIPTWLPICSHLCWNHKTIRQGLFEKLFNDLVGWWAWWSSKALHGIIGRLFKNVSSKWSGLAGPFKPQITFHIFIFFFRATVEPAYRYNDFIKLLAIYLFKSDFPKDLSDFINLILAEVFFFFYKLKWYF